MGLHLRKYEEVLIEVITRLQWPWQSGWPGIWLSRFLAQESSHHSGSRWLWLGFNGSCCISLFESLPHHPQSSRCQPCACLMHQRINTLYSQSSPQPMVDKTWNKYRSSPAPRLEWVWARSALAFASTTDCGCCLDNTYFLGCLPSSSYCPRCSAGTSWYQVPNVLLHTDSF